MLNRALHISTEPSAEWRPLLEKNAQFRAQPPENRRWFSTLVHLWWWQGEPYPYIGMKRKYFPETTVKANMFMPERQCRAEFGSPGIFSDKTQHHNICNLLILICLWFAGMVLVGGYARQLWVLRM